MMGQNQTENLTATQQAVLEIWHRLLNGNDIGIDDNFFEVGGDSLRATQMYEQICERFKSDLPTIDNSAVPTIRHLATIIDAKPGSKADHKFRALKLIQKGSEGEEPLFLVHGGTGVARVFKLLTDELDPRLPVYAFRWLGWDGQPAGTTSLTELATIYRKELQQMKPHGPYRLGGYCIGGLIALEMARQLTEAGEELDGPLFIWDTPNIESKAHLSREPWYNTKEREAFDRQGQELIDRQAKDQPNGTPIEVPTKYSGSYEFVRRSPFLNSIARQGEALSMIMPARLMRIRKKKVPIKLRWGDCLASLFYGIQKHRAKTYPGDVVYFRSGVLLGRPMNLTGWWDDAFLGFHELNDGAFTGYVVGGGHVDVLADPVAAGIVSRTYFKTADETSAD